MDWPTFVVSAGVSAVVSWFTVRALTVRKARTELAEAARLSVKEVVQPLLSELGRYEYIRLPKAKRNGVLAALEDHTQVVQVRSAAEGLRWWRRALVKRRCRRVFGRYWVDLAEDFPTKDSTLSFLASALKDDQVRDGETPTDGLIHHAYSQ